MSADLLREAAALMRQRAEAATPGPWERRWGFPAYVSGPGPTVTINDLTGDTEIEDAEHIASWHPAVALAVADWLDAAYADWHHSEHSLSAASVRAMSGGQNLPDGMALAVARAYLGRSADDVRA